MDLRAYYKKIRALEAAIAEPFVMIISRETPDGGKPGVRTHVPKALAARLIVEERAVLASPEDAAECEAGGEEQWRAAQVLSDMSDAPFSAPPPSRAPRAAKRI